MTVEEIENCSFEELFSLGSFQCSCGKVHHQGVQKVAIEADALLKLPDYLKAIGSKKPFIISGYDTFASAGEKVISVLDDAGISYSKYVFPHSPVRPTEFTVGSAVMHFDYGCDSIVGIGSGVINDTAKLLARATSREYIVVATAPSMDGFVSGTSSMDVDGLKVSLYSKAPWGVIGDLNILANAPMHLLLSGVGDMLAKISSLVEWRLAEIIVGEDYCPVIAALIDKAVKCVFDKADELLIRDPEAIGTVMEGLIVAGIAMNYAGVSRPASGMEHYFSHIWDMRSLAIEGARFEQHGIQAGIGTLYTIRAYEKFLETVKKPDGKKATDYVNNFSNDAWNEQLLKFIGPGACAMIEGERHEHKYDPEKHRIRFSIIEKNWNEIVSIIRTLMPSTELEAFMKKLGIPTDASCIGYDKNQIRTTFMMTKDIRDKYVGTRLFWDLGVLDEVADKTFL